MFPIAISGFFFRLATTDVAISGSEVPIATTVTHIVSSDNHNCLVISIAQFTIHSHPIISHVNHPAISSVDFVVENCSIVSFSAISVFFIFLAIQNMYVINNPNSPNNNTPSNLLTNAIPHALVTKLLMNMLKIIIAARLKGISLYIVDFFIVIG
jgi:hypothetical protein